MKRASNGRSGSGWAWLLHLWQRREPLRLVADRNVPQQVLDTLTGLGWEAVRAMNGSHDGMPLLTFGRPKALFAGHRLVIALNAVHADEACHTFRRLAPFLARALRSWEPDRLRRTLIEAGRDSLSVRYLPQGGAGGVELHYPWLWHETQASLQAQPVVSGRP